MTLPTNRQIEVALAEAIIMSGFRQRAKCLAARAMEIATARRREVETDKLNVERLTELRKQEWIERLERERGLRGRAHPRPDQPPEEDGP